MCSTIGFSPSSTTSPRWDEPFAVWICTFLHVPGMRPRSGPVEALCEIVGRNPGLPFVLAHGGGPDLLRLATAVRSAPNALLDLSYTLTRFQDTSVQLDLAHLLTNFDNRLVFGSDFPEAEPRARVSLLERLAARCGNPTGLPKVLGENLYRALALDGLTAGASPWNGSTETHTWSATNGACGAWPLPLTLGWGTPGSEHVRFR